MRLFAVFFVFAALFNAPTLSAQQDEITSICTLFINHTPIPVVKHSKPVREWVSVAVIPIPKGYTYNPSKYLSQVKPHVDTMGMIDPITLQEDSLSVVVDSSYTKTWLTNLSPLKRKQKINWVVYDTVMQIDPVNLTEEIVVAARDSVWIYYEAGSVKGADLMRFLENGFMLQCERKPIPVTTAWVYFETSASGQWLELKYRNGQLVTAIDPLLLLRCRFIIIDQLSFDRRSFTMPDLYACTMVRVSD